MPRTQFSIVQDALHSAIPPDIPDALRQKLSDSIGYANEYSLRRRLKDLLGGLRTSSLEMLQISNSDGLTELLVKTRNYLTHFDDASKTSLVEDIVRMHYMNERLTALLLILILKRLGMDETIAAKGVLKRRYFQ